MRKEKRWGIKFQSLIRTCQREVKKTTVIGKKMLSASKTNTKLHEAYSELGQLANSSLKNGDLKWNHPKVEELLDTIEQCQAELAEVEDEVNHIKFSNFRKGPLAKD